MNITRRAASVSLVALSLLIASCGDDKPAATKPSAAAKTSPVAPAGAATIKVGDVGELKQVLVAADGRTLYMFEKDSGATSACAGACLVNWPAYTAAEPLTAGPGVDASKLKVVQGAVAGQVSYNGHLLYFFKGDSRPGDANGIGMPSLYAVTADGAPAGK